MIIGFVGKKQSGKSTACEIVEGDLPDVRRVNMKDALINEVKVKFPDLLKELAEMYECTIDELFTIKPYKPLVRNLLKNYGTEVVRAIDENYWVNAWKATAQMMVASGFHVVVDDVRFLNEADVVKRMGGVIVRISRTDLKDTDTHASEMEMDQIVPNYKFEVGPGELDLLKLKVRSIYKHLAE